MLEILLDVNLFHFDFVHHDVCDLLDCLSDILNRKVLAEIFLLLIENCVV